MTDQQTIDAFHQLFYARGAWGKVAWRGVPMQKYPGDLLMYQRIIWETKPTLIIEVGSCDGGSALFLSDVMKLVGMAPNVGMSPNVITIDINSVPKQNQRNEIVYITGDSADRKAMEYPLFCAGFHRTMVILDGDHRAAQVAKELELYAPLVSPGCYMVVEDTNINGHPVIPGFGPGPMEALDAWLPQHADEWEVDASCEAYLITANPGGWLKKKERA